MVGCDDVFDVQPVEQRMVKESEFYQAHGRQNPGPGYGGIDDVEILLDGQRREGIISPEVIESV